MTCGLVHASYSLPEWQAVKLTFFAPWLYYFLFVLGKGVVFPANIHTPPWLFSGDLYLPPPPPLPLPPHYPRISKVQFCFTLSFKNFGLKSPSLSEFPTTLHGVDMNIFWDHTFLLSSHLHYQTTVASIQSIFFQPWFIFITWFKIFISRIGRVHRRVHQEEKPHKCDVEGCDKAFKTPAELSRHAFRHTGEKPHKCDQCDKAFIRYDDLKRHYRIHTGRYSMYYNCTVCTF